ncbi:MAG: N-acetylmuramoyl-L-alanine amidase [Henriciella sp.]|nr:N-acetylmuramoyl-L-alanine amidase [Henriciella sp.]
MEIEVHASPNFNQRKAAIDMLVLHYTGMETGQAALERMCDPAAEVSAHYMVWEDGRVFQLVPEEKRAWHAGVSTWQGDEDLNSRSIGIEIVNGGHDFPLPGGVLPPYPTAQIEALIDLVQGILARWDIPAHRIVGHSDIAPARKDDPGEHFPWDRLARAGVGLWPLTRSDNPLIPADVITTGQAGERLKAIPPSLRGAGLQRGSQKGAVGRMQAMLAIIGYNLPETGVYDAQTEAVVRAFQRRWVPDLVTGNADLETLRLIGLVSTLYKISYDNAP